MADSVKIAVLLTSSRVSPSSGRVPGLPIQPEQGLHSLLCPVPTLLDAGGKLEVQPLLPLPPAPGLRQLLLLDPVTLCASVGLPWLLQVLSQQFGKNSASPTHLLIGKSDTDLKWGVAMSGWIFPSGIVGTKGLPKLLTVTFFTPSCGALFSCLVADSSSAFNSAKDILTVC